jgi:hypothetical protein
MLDRDVLEYLRVWCWGWRGWKDSDGDLQWRNGWGR